MDLSQYRELFISESRGHLEAFNTIIVQIEGTSGDQDAVNELFRHAHSIKGMAATMQFATVAELAHKLEDLLGKIRSGEFGISPAVVDLLLEGSDLLGAMITTIEAGNDATPPAAAALIERLASFTPSVSTPPPADPSPHDAVDPDQAPTAQLASQHQFRQSDTFKSVRVKTEILDHLVNITGELITVSHRLIDQTRASTNPELEETLGRFSALVRELRDGVFESRMLPFGFLAERFPRLVRDLARRQGKEVCFRIEGQEIELDRRILEALAEPLVHLLRNALDHGLESPDERAASGKPREGRIGMTIVRATDHVAIAIEDDGRGMDPAALTARAVEQGVIGREQADAISPQEAFMLVCAPGFSTSETVSDVSGRGVGMDAVKTAVHGLAGVLAIESAPGRGSRFLLKLPITISIIHALLVECGGLIIAFPANVIDRALELGSESIRYEGGQMVGAVDDAVIPLKNIHHHLGQPLPERGTVRMPVIVSGVSGAPVGFICDRILGQREIFVKPPAPPLSRLRIITGGAILGDGRIVFVLDINALI